MKAKIKPIHDQVVVLFGATSGIGLETALLMVEKGARVAIIGRNQEGLDDALQRIRTHAEISRVTRQRGRNGSQLPMAGFSQTMPGGITGAAGETNTSATSAILDEPMVGLEADVTDWEQVRSVAEQVVQRFGRIDTWVNLAAVSEWALFEDTSPEEFRRIIDVNLVGQAYGAMAALPYMKQQQGGTLIFVSSMAGRIPIPYQSAYNASKHGILGMVETMRLELKHTGVPVNVTSILPASMNTPLFNKARTKLGVEPEPMPPLYNTKMVAGAIVHAATHPVRELIVGDAGYMMTFMRRLAPTLTSNMMGASGFRLQRSNEPKSAQAPDNLYHHISGYNQVEGELRQPVKHFSPMTWLATHPRVRMGIMAALISGIGFLIGSRIVMERSRRHRTLRYRARKFGKEARAFLISLPLISQLPFLKKRSLVERISDRLPSLHSEPSLRDRLPEPRKVAGKVVHESKRAAEKVADRIPSAEVKWKNVKVPVVEKRETLLEKTPIKK